MGGFPTGGTPIPCIAKQVARNRAQFDYIVKNTQRTRAGLAAAYTKSFKVDMPGKSRAGEGGPDTLASAAEVDSPARRYRQYQEALLHADRRFRGIRSCVICTSAAARISNWVWGTFLSIR